MRVRISAQGSSEAIYTGPRKCVIPEIPVNANFIMGHLKEVDPLSCLSGGPNWVTCEADTCRVIEEVLNSSSSVLCSYEDILWSSDWWSKIGAETLLRGDEPYHLRESDFVRVRCVAGQSSDIYGQSWEGFAAGVKNNSTLRGRLSWKKLPAGAMELNVLMFGFDSISRNTFIRKLPKSYKVLTEYLGAHVLEGYNIVGDGTPQALIPMLTGRTEVELPEVRRPYVFGSNKVDIYPFVWNDFQKYGYYTGFLEDTPQCGIFTHRMMGFAEQPTDSYMRTFYLETFNHRSNWNDYCTGPTPTHKVMLDYMYQLMKSYREYPKFLFGFQGELSHNDYNLVQAADDDLAEWLTALKKFKLLDNTILIIMSDHGHRFQPFRKTLEGKQEERLPFFSFVLPTEKMDPEHVQNFKRNIKTLSTPFDLHATFLHILGLHKNPSPVLDKNMTLQRSLSLFDKIPENRSCEQAFIEPHWCVCLEWNAFPVKDTLSVKLADFFVQQINLIIKPYSDDCAVLRLGKLIWVTQLSPTEDLLRFKGSLDRDGRYSDFFDFSNSTKIFEEIYQIQLRVVPGHNLFEATLKYNVVSTAISLKLSDVSRITAFGDQSWCTHKFSVDLRKYCYCR